MESSKKLDYLDSLRGLASIIVVISHITLFYFPYLHNFKSEIIPENNYIQMWIHNSPFGFFYSGSAAVYIFFVMSGIVLSMSASKKDKGLIKSISSRYVRLSIPACMSCIFAFLIISLSIELYSLQPLIKNNDSLNINNINFFSSIYYGAIRSIFYLRGAIEYNPVLWTMSIEFYGSVCLYIAYKTRNPSMVMFIFSMLFGFINFIAFVGIFCFFIGMLLTHIIKHNKNNTKLSIILLLVGLYFAGVHNDSTSYSILTGIFGEKTYTILNAISGTLLVTSIIINKKLKLALSNRYLKITGRYSFPIYLSHWPVLCVLYSILPLLGIYYIPLSICVIIASIIATSCVFLWVDKKSIILSKRI